MGAGDLQVVIGDCRLATSNLRLAIGKPLAASSVF